MVVHPDAQRRGIGSLLVEACANALLTAGHTEMNLYVTEAHAAAVALYRKLGFKQVEG